MPLRSWIEAHPAVAWLCRAAGFCIFAAAFFLPACDPGGRPLMGWFCASITLTLLAGKDTYRSPAFLAGMSGLINPLIVTCLAFSFSRRFLRLRQVLGFLVLVCMAATWTLFSMEKIAPLIGHYLWIAGALLILLPDCPGLSVRPRPAPAA